MHTDFPLAFNEIEVNVSIRARLRVSFRLGLVWFRFALVDLHFALETGILCPFKSERWAIFLLSTSNWYIMHNNLSALTAIDAWCLFFQLFPISLSICVCIIQSLICSSPSLSDGDAISVFEILPILFQSMFVGMHCAAHSAIFCPWKVHGIQMIAYDGITTIPART